MNKYASASSGRISDVQGMVSNSQEQAYILVLCRRIDRETLYRKQKIIASY